MIAPLVIAAVVIAASLVLIARAVRGAATETPREDVPDNVWHPKGWIK